ncbi:unannotated protein [freshwater metagenome]|uniref:lipoyl(octanoyl) transferase n=1 Tax=freshwater metagenome TaxID=449393 RepID=A0A6J7XQQ1_9ZZZZ|nr:lipoyl(octanoyl) transferase LipB [Actinomycetota bacterium]
MAIATGTTHSAIALSRSGLIDYESAWKIQREIHAAVVSGERPNSVLLLEHLSVYTAGRRTQESEKPQDGSPVIDVDRGGKITWHGPGQLVGYPIVKLARPTELVGFVREIESALIATCLELGLHTQRIEGRSGVWVVDEKGERKVAAIGIRVAKGVTMHGFALNVCPDLSAYSQIIPCGISDASVTSMSDELAAPITIDVVSPILERHLFESLSKVSA